MTVSDDRWLRRLVRHAAVRRGALTVTAVAVVVGVVADLAFPLLSRSALDHATGAAKAGWALSSIIAVMVAVAAVRYLSTLGRRWAAGVMAVGAQRDLRVALLDTVLHLDGAAQHTIRTGQVVSRSISDLQVVQGLLAMAPLAIGGAVQGVLTFVIMAHLSLPLTLVTLLLLPVLGVTVYRSRRRLFAATWSAQQAAADVATHVEETVTGVRVVKGFGQEDRMVDRLVGLGRTLYARRVRAAHVEARYAPFIAALPQAATVAVIGLGAALVLRGSITAGTFLAFAAYVTALMAITRMLSNVVISAQLAHASAQRVFSVIDHPRETDPADPRPIPDGDLGLRFADTAFGYPHAADTPVLRGVDLAVAPGECVAVIGGPGTGKSTLADLAIRHYRAQAGSIELTTADGRGVDVDAVTAHDLRAAVAVVPDEPFLYSDTIAANVAMAPLEQLTDEECERLDTVLAEADADGFVSALPDGVASVVGERGLTLSGGQRQRLALARALYAQPRVLILDDATSAVDSTTEAAILSRLRGQRATMLVLAHRMSTLRLADRVAILDGGRIVETGTLDELTRGSARFSTLMSQAATIPLPDSPVDDERPDRAGPNLIDAEPLDDLWPQTDDDEQWRPTGAPRGPGGGVGAGMGGGMAMSGALGAAQATPELLADVAALPPADADPKADVAQLRGEAPDFSLRTALAPVRVLLTLTALCVAADTLVGLAFPSLARISVDAAGSGNAGPIVRAVVLGALFVVVGWALSIAALLLSTRAGERVLFGLRVRSFAHLQRLGLDYYERELSGRIMTRMTTDIDALSTFVQTGLTSAGIAALTLVGVAAALAITQPSLAVALIPVIPVLVAATWLFRRISSRAYLRSRELVSVVNADLQENIAGLATTQGFGHTRAALDRFARYSDDWFAARMVTQRTIACFFPFIVAVADLATAAVLVLGAHRIAAGTLSTGALIAFVLYLAMLFGPVQQLTQVFDGYQQARVGLIRIRELLTTPSTLESRADADPVPHPTAGPRPAHLVLDGVGFSYPGSGVPALAGIDLDIPAGSSLALVGSTGAGKSTVVKLLARFYDPTEGSVRADDEDLRDVALHAYRSRLAVVPQEPHLFAGTVAQNIAFGRPSATRAQIEAAAAAVGALDVIASLPGAMNHAVGERGRGLSSGQRQLLALARAELVEPDLVLLDEATATLDQQTEARVLAAARATTSRRTSVIVAHRLATAAQADSIAVIEAGRVVQQGTHAELISVPGRYSQLWEASADTGSTRSTPRA
ncbi:ABC transporter ATP-binding protein [Gordonia crocea]|uniref:ABC transporter n=1 Tax=Gordonia crocea TaxID=589162 RepID=A0A7I9UW37_9ACTN|nr:ABC transporter ATP-binding protein [Gordonia crocea]GED97417.1 ABC transporter [Gordonia crocea]